MAHLVFVSVLNSVQHRRVYFQLARSAKKIFDRVTVIGINNEEFNKRRETSESIQLVSLNSVPRISLRRFFRLSKLKKLIYELKPTHLCITTPELLPIAFSLKQDLYCKVIYDVHENYLNNILFGAGWWSALRPFLAHKVRKMEMEAISFLDGVIYAEEGYDNMLLVPNEKKIIIRNVYVPSGLICKKELPPQPYLLVTGMWAKEWGTLRAIDLFLQAKPKLKGLNQLVIAGFTPSMAFHKKVVNATQQHPEIILEGGTQPVPYPRIEQLIAGCNAGFGLYQPSPRMMDRIPTKFYEFAHFRKPLFFTDFAPWNHLNERYSFGYGLPYDDISKSVVILTETILNHPPQSTSKPEKWNNWEDEEKEWIAFLGRII